MTSSVTVNDRTVVHRQSGGFALGFPDVCITPPNDVPVPYMNLALVKDAAATCTSVLCDGQPVMKQSSFLSTSYGDEPGQKGGVISGCFAGKASFATFAYDVRFEGEPVPRAHDLMFMNHGSPFNLADYLQQVVRGAALKEAICYVFCGCNFPFGKMFCFKPWLAVMKWGQTMMGSWLPHWDPISPGVWIEVPYDMTKKPPVPYGSYIDSQHQKNGQGHSLPLPTSEHEMLPGSLRPDIVVTKDPTKPPTPDNIEVIYEIKFDGDSTGDDRRKQVEAYQQIHKNVVVLDAKECGCKGDKGKDDHDDWKPHDGPEEVHEPKLHPHYPFIVPTLPEMPPITLPKLEPWQVALLISAGVLVAAGGAGILFGA